MLLSLLLLLLLRAFLSLLLFVLRLLLGLVLDLFARFFRLFFRFLLGDDGRLGLSRSALGSLTVTRRLPAQPSARGTGIGTT